MINESNTIHFDMHKYSIVTIVTQGCTQPSIQVYILESTEQVPEKAFWLTSGRNGDGAPACVI